MGGCGTSLRGVTVQPKVREALAQTGNFRAVSSCSPPPSPASGLVSIASGISTDSDDVPLVFQEILAELSHAEQRLGGVRNFKGRPRIERKVKACDFRRVYTDFEYVYLTVLGFAALSVHVEDIVALNNGRKFTENPGVRLLEQRTGMTMHADREGANHLLRSAPNLLMEAYAVAATDRAGRNGFFQEAFDRNADPCLEGRVNRILEYLHSRSQVLGATNAPPPEDLVVQSLGENATPQAIVGEHLRVFVNECTWRWARERGIDYDIAKAQTDQEGSDFDLRCNAETFEATLLARGVASDVAGRQWEVKLEDGTWTPYGVEQNEALERGRLAGAASCEVTIRNWVYEMDLTQMVQRNIKTYRERPIRCAARAFTAAQGRGRLLHAEIKAAIAHFVGLDTLAEAPFMNSVLSAQSSRSAGSAAGAPASNSPAAAAEATRRATAREAPHGAQEELRDAAASRGGGFGLRLPGDATGGASL